MDELALHTPQLYAFMPRGVGVYRTHQKLRFEIH